MDKDNLDTFSRLTSSLLVLIVSYLPFKEAARTSILSKQWRNIWRETTHLEFDEKSFVNLEETDENQRIERSSFFDFIRQFLANYPRKPLQKFSMTCSKPEGFLAEIQNFVIFAISRNVKELELDFSDPTWREEDDPENHPAAVELPFQVQRFCHPERGFFRVDRDEFSFYQHLVAEIPIFRETEFKEVLEHRYHIEITMPTLKLKDLVLNKCNFIQDFLWIEGPRLRFLKYSGKVGHFHLENQTEMVEADLDIGMEHEFDEIGLLLYSL